MRTLPYWFAGGLILLAVLFLGTASEHLLLGWLYFPLRVVPRITVDPPAALIGLASLIAFILLLHLSMRWLRAGSAWSWRSTAALAALVIILFAAGTAMVGALHQSVWLTFGRSGSSVSPDPVYGLIDTIQNAANRAEAGNHLKQLALDVQNFHDVFNALPPGGTKTDDGQIMHGWMTYSALVMSFSSEGIEFAVPWNQPPNDRYFKCNYPRFVNPSIPGPYFDAEGFGLTHFAGNQHVLPIQTIAAEKPPAINHPMKQLAEGGQTLDLQSVSDGTSNTLLVGTVTERFKPWGHPVNVRDPALGLNRSPDGFAAPPGWSAAVFAMCDGSTRAINPKIDPEVLRQLATPAGGEPLPAEFSR